MEELSKEKEFPSSRDKKGSKSRKCTWGKGAEREDITSDHSGPWSVEARETTSVGEGVTELGCSSKREVMT